jgi:hypothetical protein
LGGGPVRRKAATYTGQHKYMINAEILVPRVGFEHRILVFERAKTVHALDCAAAMINRKCLNNSQLTIQFGQTLIVINFLIGLLGGGVESNWVHSALRPLIGLLCQPRLIMMMEKLVQ